MRVPNLDDTIVAVSTAWQSAPLGCVRLSGPESSRLAQRIGAVLPAERRSTWTATKLTWGNLSAVPATTLWFFAPRSYTGQDVVELHLPGCLSLLRNLCDHLIADGARRALPGEFTARAYLNGKLSATEVEQVAGLLRDEHATLGRARQRATGIAERAAIAELTDQLTDLLTRLEAGIDFVEEEHVVFITAADLSRRLRGMQEIVKRASQAVVSRRAETPHVSLVGLPNAGKSTLFNRLLGEERAIVSPVLGTTRDVLSAEIELWGTPIVLQDCAGLGAQADELALAARRAAEQAADEADVVLWVHAVDTPFDAREVAAAQQLEASRRVLVWNKCDLPAVQTELPPPAAAEEIRLSAATGAGIDALRALLARLLDEHPHETGASQTAANWPAVSAALDRAEELIRVPTGVVDAPELIALEIRTALETLEIPTSSPAQPLDETILERVFREFCVGK